MLDRLTPADIRLGARPLIVCDVDEVVLEFIKPFRSYLQSAGLDLLPRSFRLHGNVVSLADGTVLGDGAVSERLNDFFGLHDKWQFPAPLAVETLGTLSEIADIVFLTAMPQQHSVIRRNLLDRFGLPFPLLVAEDAKGPMVRALHGDRPHPFVFIDDILRNLKSVEAHAPNCLLINVIADRDYLAMAPDPGKGIVRASDWTNVSSIVRAHFDRHA